MGICRLSMLVILNLAHEAPLPRQQFQPDSTRSISLGQNTDIVERQPGEWVITSVKK